MRHQEKEKKKVSWPLPYLYCVGLSLIIWQIFGRWVQNWNIRVNKSLNIPDGHRGPLSNVVLSLPKNFCVEWAWDLRFCEFQDTGELLIHNVSLTFILLVLTISTLIKDWIQTQYNRLYSLDNLLPKFKYST